MEAKKGYKAQVKHLLISPKKLRPIADTIRRKPYNQAIAILETTPKRGAGLIKKVVQSAVANALYQNNKLDEDSLYISEVFINEGPRMKRVWARARGRRDILLKRMSHISVVVDEIARMGE